MMNEFSSPPNLNPQAQGYIDGLFGGLPSYSGGVSATLMHRLERGDHFCDNWKVYAPCGVGGAVLEWTMVVYWPSWHAQVPVLLSPDGCWPHCVNEEIAHEVGKLGVALAWFNRLDLAFDPPDSLRSGPAFDAWPRESFGAISAWAWGLQRCVDALLLTQHAAPQGIGVIGHSRGGKAALLAGATDPRIRATISHNSGTGGAGSLRVMGQGSESLADLAQRFAHWLGPEAPKEATQQQLTTTDNLPLLRAIAPRGLCLLQASDDAWANPAGTQYAYGQLQPTWAAQRVPHCIDWQERTGGHAMTALDWVRAAAFLQRVIGG
jgi:dienelactone hydrolase